MSILNSSLAFEETLGPEREVELKLLVKARPDPVQEAILAGPKFEPAVVKVTGSLIVSF